MREHFGRVFVAHPKVIVDEFMPEEFGHVGLFFRLGRLQPTSIRFWSLGGQWFGRKVGRSMMRNALAGTIRQKQREKRGENQMALVGHVDVTMDGLFVRPRQDERMVSGTFVEKRDTAQCRFGRQTQNGPE